MDCFGPNQETGADNPFPRGGWCPNFNSIIMWFWDFNVRSHISERFILFLLNHNEFRVVLWILTQINCLSHDELNNHQ
jgi:hypothetical protein